jgi:hypothetical protein
LRITLAIVSACLVWAHLTGGMKGLFAAFDLGVELRDMPYLLALPGMGLFTLFMLRN